MRISINQPAFLPWSGYFERIAMSDLHVVLDHVQFEKNSVTNRNRIKGCNGPMWLTVPVKTRGRFKSNPILSLEIAEDDTWRRRHLRSIEMSYRNAAHLNSLFPALEAAYSREWTHLCPLISACNSILMDALGITTRIASSSSITDLTGHKSELVLNLCRHFGATEYISGPFGRDYLDLESFRRNGIRVRFHEHQRQIYRQLYGAFTPDLSVVDLIFNEGDAARQLYRASDFEMSLRDS